MGRTLEKFVFSAAELARLQEAISGQAKGVAADPDDTSMFEADG